MRRMVLALLAAVLAGIVAMRAEQPGQENALAAMAPVDWDESYNVLYKPLSGGDQTAGSGDLAEIESYFLGRAPTAKNDCTGLLAGQDLVLILAEDWSVPAVAGPDTPALYRLWSEGAQLTQVYAPDWYQGRDGREFALLAGMTPTTVRAETALDWTGKQGIHLPMALAQSLGRASYTCWAFPDRPGHEDAYMALGFSHMAQPGESPTARLEEMEGDGPFFAYWVLPGGSREAALEELLRALDGPGQDRRAAVCLVTGHADPMRGHIFLWGEGLSGRRVDMPCSELDAAPTLLNLLGAEMDSRFFSGRDLFAPAEEGQGEPIVSLYGSAFSDWVTEKGSYIAAEDAFFPASETSAGQMELDRYIARIRGEVYARYVYARKVMETDHFRAAGW